SANPLGRASLGVQTIQLQAAGAVISFDPARQTAVFGEKALSLSNKLSDSKGWVFDLGANRILKIYGGPRYSPNQLSMVREWANHELEVFKQLAPEGIVPRIWEVGETSDGVLYAVLEKPRGASLARTGKMNARLSRRQIQAIRKLAQTLASHGIWEQKLNPTQISIDGDQAMLVKVYTDTRHFPDPAAPERQNIPLLYQKKIDTFRALPKIWRDYASGKDRIFKGISARTIEGYLRMLLESIRKKEPMIIGYVNNRGEEKTFILQPTQETVKYDDLWKGFFKARLTFEGSPKQGGKELTFRVDHILWAKFQTARDVERND
ncbi:MAG: hypothetical protein HY551_07310, partial [Elusimicrobia bacterium]|nr:hypothetical protein [Elusimicrobiota bacterium]